MLKALREKASKASLPSQNNDTPKKEAQIIIDDVYYDRSSSNGSLASVRGGDKVTGNNDDQPTEVIPLQGGLGRHLGVLDTTFLIVGRIIGTGM